MNDRLLPGQSLKGNETLTSDNEHYRLVMQLDGNLVLYDITGDEHQPIWNTETPNKPVRLCVMQQDGNLVLYDWASPTPNAIWNSGVTHENSSLVLTNKGELILGRLHHDKVLHN